MRGETRTQSPTCSRRKIAQGIQQTSNADLFFDAVEVAFGADQQIRADHGIGGEGALAEVVLGEDFEGLAGFHDDAETFFVLKVEFAVGNEQ
jgi:hypothetical protein